MNDLREPAYKFKTVMSENGDSVTTVGETVISLDNGDKLILPDGFRHDGASIPKGVPRWLIDRFGRHNLAAAIHDMLYRYGRYCTLDGRWVTVTRKRADRVFLEIMRRSGVWWWRRRVMYNWVRRLGWIPWNRYRKERGE